MFMLFLLLIAFAVPGVQQQSLPAQFDDHAIVTPRRIERTHGKGEDRWTDVTTLPVVTGLRPEVLKHVHKELELKNVVGGFFYKVYKARKLIGFNYSVTYNRHQILSMTFTWNAMFNHYDKSVVFDLRDGSLVEAQNLFREDKIQELAKLVDEKLQAELDQMIRDYKGQLNLRDIWKKNGPMTITPEHLAVFVIDDKGITFFYRPYLYHVYAWAEPEGRYFFKYSELKNFLKPSSVVSQFVE